MSLSRSAKPNSPHPCPEPRQAPRAPPPVPSALNPARLRLPPPPPGRTVLLSPCPPHSGGSQSPSSRGAREEPWQYHPCPPPHLPCSPSSPGPCCLLPLPLLGALSPRGSLCRGPTCPGGWLSQRCWGRLPQCTPEGAGTLLSTRWAMPPLWDPGPPHRLPPPSTPSSPHLPPEHQP